MISIFRQPIVFDGTSTPVKTALFLIICAAWILPGLIGHDPWKPDEAIHFGVIYSMLHEGQWMVPSIAGLPNYDYPPLYYWTAALLAQLFSPILPLHDGARLASGVFMAIALFFTHKTAKRLFDERAGRLSVLLLIGCLGMFVRGHEINPELAGLAGLAYALYGMTRIRSEPSKGGVATGIGAGVIALSIGIVPAMVPVLIALTLMYVLRDWHNRAFRRGIGIAFLVSVPFMLVFPAILVLQSQPSLLPWMGTILGMPLQQAALRRTFDFTYFVTVLPWFGLPALPFALWLWWKDRAKLRDRVELALPLAAFVTLLVTLSFTRKANDAAAVVLLIPLALAAASTLDRLPRSLASFMDSIGLVFFGLGAIAVWLYWTAAVTGYPEGAARAMARQVPGFTFEFGLISFSLALALSVIWIYAVARAHRNNRRAVVNWTAGVTLLWMLINMLGLPAVDHVRSYRSTAKIIADTLPSSPNGCVASLNLGDAQRATLDYFANLRFVDISQPAAADCRWLLTQGTRTAVPAVENGWQIAWEGARPGDNIERFRLYLRVSPATTR